MFVNHWGKWVDSNQPVGGVVSIHSVEWINDEVDRDSINLSEIEALDQFIEDRIREWEAAYWESAPDFAPDPVLNEAMIQLWCDDFAEMGEGYDPQRYLIGDWLKDEHGLYDPDLAGEYAAIVHYDGGMTIQIVRSKWVTRAALCSPCYPGQVDLDTPGEYLGFDLPPELYGDRRQNPNPTIEL